MTGKGTKNFVPLWTGATTLGNSMIYETGGKLGIGTKTPKATVDVASTGLWAFRRRCRARRLPLSGIATATKGGTTGVYGQSSDPGGNAVFGLDNATTGGIGVIGQSNATSGSSYGVYGQSASTAIAPELQGSRTPRRARFRRGRFDETAVRPAPRGSTVMRARKRDKCSGSSDRTTSSTNFAAGVSGNANATSGQVYGVVGGSNSTTTGAVGRERLEPATTGQVYGVSGSNQ